MKTVLQKLTSRKFLAALSCLITGVVMLFTSEEAAETITGGVMMILPTVAYILTEGKIDAASVKTVADGVGQILDAIDGELIKRIDTVDAEAAEDVTAEHCGTEE